MAGISSSFKRLEGKVALITGGASGIGECTAKLFAAHGAKVVIADIQDDLGHTLCNDVIGSDAATYVHCNVTDEADVKNAVDTAVSKYGKLDIMFNNAGISDGNTNLLETTTEDFERVVKVDLVGPFLGLKQAARVMVPEKSGSIVMMGSVSSVIGGVGTYGYASAKNGVMGLTRNGAAELGRQGVRVNCVSPHGVATPLLKGLMGLDEKGVAEKLYSTMKGKYCKAEDVAAAVLFLASDESKYVNGLNLMVDGGFTVENAGLSAYEDTSKSMD